MLKNFAATLLIALPVASFAMADASVGSASDAANQQLAKNSADIRQAMQIVQEARSAYSNGRYSDAVESYRTALSMFPSTTATAKTIEFIQLSLSDALIAKAMDYREVGRTEEAVSFLNEAIQLAPDSKKAQSELSKTLDPVRTNPAMTPYHQVEVKEVERLLELAYGYYNLGRYDEAEKIFKSVIDIDPYNSAAQSGLKNVYTRKMASSRVAYDSVRSKALADVAGTYAAMLEVEYSDTAAPTSEADISHEDYGLSSEELATADYLSSIQVANVLFEDAPMSEVLDVLRGILRRAVAENPPPGKISTNITTNFGDANSEAVQEIESRKLSLRLSDVNFRDLLTKVCAQLSITHYYAPLGIELTYSGRDFGPMSKRTFLIPPYFFSGDEESSEESDDPFATTSTVRIRRINALNRLKEMGISFPKGATASYNASTRKLMVYNTVYNLDQIQDLLDIVPEGDKLVVLNIFLMSVDQDVLDDLGFEVLLDFSLGEKYYGGGGSPQTVATASGMPSIQTLAGSTAPYVSNGLRTGEEVFVSSNIEKLISSGGVNEYTSASNQKSPGIFGFRGVWSAADLTVLMRGLNQKKGVDLMQNPQLIFRPGMEEQVSIACVREMYYPVSYAAPSVEQSSVVTNYTQSDNIDSYSELIDDILENGDIASGAIVIPAHPEEFEFFGITEDQFAGIGTIVQVHNAEILNGGQFVKLDMSATVNEFEGFVDWGTPIYTSGFSGDEVVTMELSGNSILMPMFKRSYQNTSVTLASGSVVVLGGLQESMKVKYEDKIPVIGDLPLVGRLFRSEGQQNKTKALLFFAKVNIIDPSGLDTKTGLHPEQDPM